MSEKENEVIEEVQVEEFPEAPAEQETEDGQQDAEELTAMLEDYSRPRPMTADEREALLAVTFAASGW